jgi:hypothetical protein
MSQIEQLRRQVEAEQRKLNEIQEAIAFFS